MLLFLVESKFSQEGLIRRRIKVIQWQLPSWVQPKRVTKRCNRHAKQDTDEHKSIRAWCDDTMTALKCG